MLFDIDSTLLRDGGAAGTAFNRAFLEQFGKPPAHTDKYGKTDPVIAQEIAVATLGRVLEPSEVAFLHKRYSELLPDCLYRSDGFAVYPGAAELVSALERDGSFTLGIQTGNLEPCARAKLHRAGMDRHFKFGGFGSDSPDRARLVAVAVERGRAFAGWKNTHGKVLLIGDSPLDILAGKANGVFTVGVATGKSSPADLTNAGAGAVVKDLTDTAALVNLLRQ